MLWKICRRADSELAPTCFAGCYDLTEEDETLQRNSKRENLAFLLHFCFWRANHKCWWCVNSWPKLVSALGLIPLSPQQDKLVVEQICKVCQGWAGGSISQPTGLPWFGTLPITKDYTTAANSFIVLWKSLWLGLIPESSGIRDWALCRENELEWILFNIQNFLLEL